MTSGEPHPFRWCDIQLYTGHLQLDVFRAKASQLRAADWSGMTFTVQKSGVPSEIVGHARSGALHACLVMGLAELCLLLRKHGAPPMMCHWGHTVRSPLALYATSRVATTPRPSNLQLAYMGQNLVLGRMMSVLAASVPLTPWPFSVAVLTAVASAS